MTEQDSSEIPPEQKRKQQEELLKRQIAVILEPEAYQRLMSIRLVNPELFMKSAQYLIQISSQLGRKLTEQELVQLLKRLKGPERETRIQFKRK